MTLSELTKVSALFRRLEKKAVTVTPATTLSAIEKGIGGLGSLISGTHRAIRAGSTGAGQSVAQSLGGGAGGRLLGKAIEYSPYAIGGYALNKVLDDPVGQFVREKIDEYRLKRMQNAAAFDPSTGTWT